MQGGTAGGVGLTGLAGAGSRHEGFRIWNVGEAYQDSGRYAVLSSNFAGCAVRDCDKRLGFSWINCSKKFINSRMFLK